MPGDVSLSSITFKALSSNREYINSVQCTLSNGNSSPLFETVQGEHQQPKTVDFDRQRPIRKVTANHSDGYIKNIRFYDGDNQLVADYPMNSSNPELTHNIGPNEELIGVYGVN